jgi:hypothetical protein
MGAEHPDRTQCKPSPISVNTYVLTIWVAFCPQRNPIQSGSQMRSLPWNLAGSAPFVDRLSILKGKSTT